MNRDIVGKAFSVTDTTISNRDGSNLGSVDTKAKAGCYGGVEKIKIDSGVHKNSNRENSNGAHQVHNPTPSTFGRN